MTSTNATTSIARNRISRSYSYTFEPEEERRRDTILRSAFMAVVAPFQCRPDPRGPWDETNTGDLTPWSYPLGLLRNAMASAVVTKDRATIDRVQEAVRNFCHELEADVTSIVPAREAESLTQIALDETHAEGFANEVEMALVRDPSPTNADRAVIPLTRQLDRISALVRECRRAARTVSPQVASRVSR